MKRFKRLLLQILLLPVMPVFAKGDSKGPEITAGERANAEVAARSWTHYVKSIKPAVEGYVTDVRSGSAPNIDESQGMANADIQQKIAGQTFNPNQPGADNAAKFATMKSGMDLNAAAGVNATKAKSLQGVLDAGQGKATSALAGMTDIAQQASAEALQDNQLDYKKTVSNGRTFASGLGMAAGVAHGMDWSSGTGFKLPSDYDYTQAYGDQPGR